MNMAKQAINAILRPTRSRGKWKLRITIYITYTYPTTVNIGIVYASITCANGMIRSMSGIITTQAKISTTAANLRIFKFVLRSNIGQRYDIYDKLKSRFMLFINRFCTFGSKIL